MLNVTNCYNPEMKQFANYGVKLRIVSESLKGEYYGLIYRSYLAAQGDNHHVTKKFKIYLPVCL